MVRPHRATEVARIIGDQHEITLANVARNIPVFPTGLADMRDMLRIMAGFPGNFDKADAKALVDQKSHDAAMLSIRLRARWNGFRPRQG